MRSPPILPDLTSARMHGDQKKQFLNRLSQENESLDELTSKVVLSVLVACCLTAIVVGIASCHDTLGIE